MLETKNLKKVYKTKKGVAVEALKGVSIKFAEKGMVFLLGKSGSGKSTLLNLLGGLDKYDNGEIIIKGVSSKDFKQNHFDSYRNTYVGFIFQEYNILEEFSIGANIALAIELQGKKATDKEINDILEKVDLVGFGDRKRRSKPITICAAPSFCINFERDCVKSCIFALVNSSPIMALHPPVPNFTTIYHTLFFFFYHITRRPSCKIFVSIFNIKFKTILIA